MLMARVVVIVKSLENLSNLATGSAMLFMPMSEDPNVLVFPLALVDLHWSPCLSLTSWAASKMIMTKLPIPDEVGLNSLIQMETYQLIRGRALSFVWGWNHLTVPAGILGLSR
jgi:hypothetical protein